MDPYSPPQNVEPPETTALAEVGQSAIQKTVPWMRFIGILFIIGAVLYVIIGVGVAISVGVQGNAEAIGGAIGVLLVYGVIGLIFGFIGKQINQTARALDSHRQRPSLAHLDAFFTHNHRTWRLFGIWALISMVLAVIAVIAAIAVPLLLST